MTFKVYQRIDEDGYFETEHKFFVQEGAYPSADMIETPLPEDADTSANFYKWDGKAWQAEKKPENAADFVGMVISHESQTERNKELRERIQKAELGDRYRLDRGAKLEWIMREISEEELASQAIDTELSEFDQQIADLKSRMAIAMLQNDEAMIAELRTEYANLMGD